MLLNQTHVRNRVKNNGKRISKEALFALNVHVEQVIDNACAQHNGGKKTVDATAVNFVLGGKRP